MMSIMICLRFSGRSFDIKDNQPIIESNVSFSLKTLESDPEICFQVARTILFGCLCSSAGPEEKVAARRPVCRCSVSFYQRQLFPTTNLQPLGLPTPRQILRAQKYHQYRGRWSQDQTVNFWRLFGDNLIYVPPTDLPASCIHAPDRSPRLSCLVSTRSIQLSSRKLLPDLDWAKTMLLALWRLNRSESSSELLPYWPR